MLDGALTMASPELAHVTWLSPQEVFEIRLRRTIEGMLRRMTTKRIESNEMAKLAAQADREVRFEIAREKSKASGGLTT